MFCMLPGESSYPEGSEYVRQKGVGGFEAELQATEVDPPLDMCRVVNEP